MSTLQGRLQNLDYQNWVKAGICLLYTKEGLEDFVSTECKQLHQNVLNHTRSLVPTPGHLICGINITRQRLINTCGHPYCQGFLSAVIQEGIDPNHPFIPRPGNLANTNVGLWHSEPYQLAKLFMNAGQLPTDKDPSETDLSGIINFLHHCKVPRNHITNPLFTDKVRQARNAVMHTPDMKVTEPDFKAYSQSMINLLNDPNISSSPRAKDAVAQIQTVTNATDFQITLQDEGKVRMDSLAAKLQTLTDEINSKLAEVEDCGVREREQIGLEIEQCKKEMTEVSSVFKTVEDKMGNQLRKLETLLAKTIGDHKDLEIQQEAYQTQTNEAIANVKLQQKQTGQAVGNLQVQQATANEEIDNLKTQQKQIGQAVGNLQVQQETANEEIDNLKTQQRQTGQVVGNLQVQQATANEEIDNLKTQQRQTDQRIDDLQNKAGQTWIPSDEDKAQLQRYLIEGYQEKLDVTLLPGWEQLHVSDIFTPMIFLGEQKQGSDKEMVYKKLDSYEEIFFKDNVLQTRVFVLGKAGAGKTTFIKHLTDVWCKRNITPQFANVEVVQKFQFFFYVSCRFAEKDKTLLHMIKYQLFKDEDEATWDVAVYVLKHNPECCFIALDGADEWEGPPTSYTGRSGDIVGLPGMAGVDGCVLLITSRPCRFYALSTKTQKIFRRLKLKGIKNVEEFAECILKKLEDPNPGQSCYNFFSQIEENNMSELMETPLMLINALGVWENDQSLHKSMCINYINMIQLFIRRAKGEEGWPISESRFLRLIPNLVNLETKWEQQLDQLPNLFLRYETLHTYAGLFLSLGHIASDLLLGEDQSLVFSKQVCKSYLFGESLNVCLALGIIAKTETTTRGIKKVERYLFCHKTFQEFFAALWLASKYATEGTILLCEHVKTVYDVYDYSILIQFLCAFCPDAGKQFWLNVAEEVMEKDEQVQRYRADGLPAGSRHFYLQDLVCRCMREARIDEKSDQCYFCCPDIWINDDTSDEDITLLCKMTYLYSNIKSMYVSYNSELPKQHVILSKVRPISSACGLQTLVLRGVCRSVLDLQKHNKLTCLKLWDLSVDSLILPSTEQPGGLLLPVEGTTISEVIIIGVTLTHHDMEQLTGWLSSCSSLEKLQLWKLSCSDHGSGCILPVLLELQKCNKLKKLELRGLSVEGLLLPVEGTRISEVIIIKVTLTHHDMEQLIRWLSSCSSLGKLHFFELSCSDHSSECILPALLDLQKCNKLESLELWSLPVEGLLLPVEGTTISEVIIIGVTLAHHDMEQMIGWLSSCSSLEKLALGCMSCSDHSSGCILPVLLDLQKCNKLKKLELWSLPVDGLLLPVEGTTISEVIIIGVTLIHHKMEQLTGCLSSCSSLEKLELGDLSCSDQSSGCIFPVLLDLQKCNKLVRLDLRNLSVEGLLLPVEGTTISEVIIIGVTLIHHKMEQLTGCLSSCSSLEKLELGDLSCSDQSSGCIFPVLLDLQKCNKLVRLDLRNLSVEGLLLPVEGTRISEVIIFKVTLTHHKMEQLTGCLSSCSSLEKLKLGDLSCSDQSSGCILPVLLDLQKCNNLGRLELRNLSVEGLLLPVEGTRISEVIIIEVTLTHHDMEQLTGSLSSCSSLEKLVLGKLSCRDQSRGCILPALLDLQNCNKLGRLELRNLSVEGLLLPVDGTRISEVIITEVILTHHGMEQLTGSLSSCSSLETLVLKLSCRDHSSGCILPVLLDLQKCNKLKKLGLRGLSVEGLLTPSHIQGHINWALLLSDVKMSAQSWRKFIETIAQYSAVPSVKLSYCNIDRDTRDFISSCSQFSVRRNDETCVQFYKVKRLL